MLEQLTDAISGDRIDWRKTPQEIVDGVEVVFSAIKDRDADEQEKLEDLWEVVKKIAELAGGAFEWPIILGAAGAFAPFAAIGAGFMEAAEKIKRDRSPIAFAEGVAMGVMAESTDFIRDQFWQEQPGRNDIFPQGGVIEQYYNNAALVLGYGYGKAMQGDNAAVFWSDLKRVDDQSLLAHGDPVAENWSPRQWRDFYIDIAGAFSRLHIAPDD